MQNNEDIKPDTKGELKWKELAIRIEHYKYYLNLALQVTVFFYLITGGVLGFYLKNPAESANHPLEYVLLLPILMGAVLGGIFIYGARLQEKLINSMEHIRVELRQKFGLDIKELHDAHLLNILLRIFGYVFFAVVVALILVPFKFAPPSSERLMLFLGLEISKDLLPFLIIASLILIVGAALPLIARWFNKRLKVRRDTDWRETVTSWCKAIDRMEKKDDVLALEAHPFYYDWLPYFSKKTIESIKDRTFKTEFLKQDIAKLKGKEESEKTHIKFKKIRVILKAAWKWLTAA